ncbi:hypothetical protein MMC07_004229 [Pseudocyphellaria aurata]|nr:hypothetical protein [Pseudocyphellaria aurata]
MKVVNGEDQERSSKTSGSTKVPSKPLKKQKSLTRLFSSRTPKPSSPPEPSPLSATGISSLRPWKLSSGSSISRGSSRKRSQDSGLIPSANGEPLMKSDAVTPKREMGAVVMEKAQPKLISIAGGVPSHITANADSVNKSSPVTPPAVDTITAIPVKQSTLQRSSTFPLILPERSCSLAAPPALNNGTREGSISSQPQLFQPTPRRTAAPFRPSTAGGYLSTDKQEPRNPQNGSFGVEAENRPVSDDVCSPDLYTFSDYKHDSDEAWKSIRSALTSHSSFYDATSTERSSVATKNTSIGGLILDSQTPTSKHNSMTVDDAIEMYILGFADEADEVDGAEGREGTGGAEGAEGAEGAKGAEKAGGDDACDTGAPDTPEHWPFAEEQGSARTAEVIHDGGFELPPPLRPSSAGSNSSAAIMFGRAQKADSPGRFPHTPTAMRDQYGFLKASNHITNEQHDIWSSEYISSQDRRTQKWLSYMEELGLPTLNPLRFPPRSAKTQRFIRKGVPPDWRGNAWFFYADGDRCLRKHPGLFATLVSRSRFELNSDDKDGIERDLHRTFPDNIRFKTEPTVLSSAQYPTPETPLLVSLRRVLQAFALHCPRIGYCQSLNFIAGLLLLFLPEEKTFWMLHIITTDYFPGTHDVDLEGAKVDLWVLMVAFKESMPGLWPKVGNVDGNAGPRDARLPTISLCTTSWFMSLFIGTLPAESVLRVWDIMFYEGSRTLFRVALAIFKLGEQHIKAMSDPMEILQMVQSLPRGMLDVSALMDVAFRRGGISQEWVEKRRKQRKQWHARARAKSAAEAATADMPSHASLPLGKSNSVWRRRAGPKAGT